MKKTSLVPLIFIFISFLYSLTHLPLINQITAQTFLDVIQLFYAIYFWIFLFGIANHYHFFNYFSKQHAIYLCCIFAGYPTYAKIINDSTIPNKNKENLMLYCSHPSLGFTIYTLGNGIFHNIKIGYIIFFIQILTNFILFLLLKEPQKIVSPNSTNQNLMSLIKSQFQQTFEVFIYIFGFMLVFRIFIYMLPIKSIFITALFEFSSACLQLENFHQPHAFILCNMFLSFSSLSVLCQSVSLCKEIHLKKLIYVRFAQSLISGILAYLIHFFIF